MPRSGFPGIGTDRGRLVIGVGAGAGTGKLGCPTPTFFRVGLGVMNKFRDGITLFSVILIDEVFWVFFRAHVSRWSLGILLDKLKDW